MVGKLYLFASVSSGESLTPVNELPITDTVLQACVLGQAAANGWATYYSNVPAVPALIGTGLWAQAVSGPSLPLEATPVSGVFVR